MRTLLSLLLIALAFLSIHPVQAQQTEWCTEAYLEEALQRGGTTVFDCYGPIPITSNKAVTKDTALVSRGDPVIFDAQDTASTIFHVQEGVSLSLHNVQPVNSSNFGILMSPGSSLYVTDSRFAWHGTEENNGAAIWNEGGRVIINNSVFERNENGPAVINEVDSWLEVTNSVFRNNWIRDEHGAAIQNEGNATITDSQFYENVVTDMTGAAIANLKGEMTITGSHIYRNDIGVYTAEDARTYFIDSTITDNTTAEEGRGILNDGLVTLTRTYIQNNPQNCDGSGDFVNLYRNFQYEDDSCGGEIPVSNREYPTYETLVTAFAVFDISSDGGLDTYAVSLSWAVYDLPVSEFRVIIESLIPGKIPTMITPISGDGVELNTTSIPGIRCGNDYVATVEAISDDGRLVLGRSYPISFTTPGCG